MGKNTFRLEVAGITKIVKLEVEDPLVNLVLYGSGFLEPGSTGGGHDTGDAFKKVAEARHAINKKDFPKAINEIFYCPTEYEFFELINGKTNLNRLDVYCHGWLHGLNLGGFKGKRTIAGVEVDGDALDWTNREQDKGTDMRRVEIHEDWYLDYSTETTELGKLKIDVFSSDPKIYFWGCNIGGQLDPSGNHIASNKPKYIEDPKESFAQEFADKIGKGNVYALVGKGYQGGSTFKTDKNGKVVFSDGEMLPANISANHKYKNTIILDATKYFKKFPL